MGTRPDTDPEMQRMIDRYVNDALMETGTAGTEPPHGRLARASVPPPINDFMAPPPMSTDDRAAQLVLELAEAMAAAEIAALPDTGYIRASVPSPPPVRVLFTPPKEFVDEAPTDLDDDEPTGLFEPPRR